jgi:hypothetical protein
MERLLNALAHDRNRWELKHWGPGGESAVLVDAQLDRLLDTWMDIVDQFDIAEAAEEIC